MGEIKKIISRENSIFKLAKKLSHKNNYDDEYFLIEGQRLLHEALKRGYECSYIFLSEDKNPSIIECDEISYITLNKALFNEISKTVNTQGVAALVKKPRYEFQDLISQKNAFVLIASAIQDPGNLGSIIRTCAAAGVTGVILTKGSVNLYNPKVIRSTMGAIFQIPVVQDILDFEIKEALNKRKIKTFVADVAAEEKYFNTEMTKPLAIVLGNENKGPADCWLDDFSTIKVKIPLISNTESLNVSTAAGILVYEVVRQSLLI